LTWKQAKSPRMHCQLYWAPLKFTRLGNKYKHDILLHIYEYGCIYFSCDEVWRATLAPKSQPTVVNKLSASLANELMLLYQRQIGVGQDRTQKRISKEETKTNTKKDKHS